MSVEHHLAAAADPYMEQLVSIATRLGASSRGRIGGGQSDRQDCEAFGLGWFTVLGAIGGLAGIAGIVDHRFHDRLAPGLAAIASDDQPIVWIAATYHRSVE